MDPRAARTRASLQEALLTLARDHPLDEISIGDITTLAQVNRSSFYQHYSDKETLLSDALEGVLAGVSDQMRTRGAPAARGALPGELADYLRHLEAHAAVYRRVLGPHGSAVVTARLRERIERIVSETVGPDAPGFEGVPVDVIAAGITGSALGVITAWVRRDPLPSVEEAADWLWRVLTGPGAFQQAEAEKEAAEATPR